MHKVRVLLATVCALAAMTMTPREVRADVNEEARKHYDRAIDLADDGQLAEALIEFQRSYDLTKHYSVLYNIGQVLVSLAKPIEAVDAFEAYLAGGGNSIPAERRASVQREISVQRGRIAILDIRVLPQGAIVQVDGREIGKAPLPGPHRVTIGEHQVTVSAEGFEPREMKVTVAGEDRRSIELALVPRVAPPVAAIPLPDPMAPPVVSQPQPQPQSQPQPQPQPPVLPLTSPDSTAPAGEVVEAQAVPEERSLSGLQVTGIVAGAAGLAGLATGTILYFLAKSRHDDAVSIWKSRNNDSKARDRQGEAKDLMTGANVALIAGGVLVGAGVVSFILGRQSAPSAEPGAQSRFFPNIIVGPGYAGVSTGGTW